MAISVLHVDGNATTTGGTSATTGTWTATAGSVLAAIVTTFNTSGAAANGDVTDSKGNTWTLCGSSFGGSNAVGIALYRQESGTRGATFNVTVNLVNSSSDSSNIAVIEMSGTSLAFDATTFATATDATSPFTVTAAAAIAGTQIALYGVVLDTSGTNAFGNPTGYTDIGELDNGSQDLVYHTSYKINETGTPAPAATNTDTVAAAREIFGSFKEGGGGDATATPSAVAPVLTIPGPTPTLTGIRYVKEVGFVTNTTAGTTSAITVAAGGVPIDDVIVIHGACDNTGTSGAATTISVADDSNNAGTANTYTLQTAQAIADPGAASAGQQGFFVVCPVTRSLDAGDTITITYGNSTTAKAINAQQWTGVKTSAPVLAGSYTTQDNQTGQAVSVSATPSKVGQAVCTLVAVEGGTADSFTEDADTTDGSWVTLTRRGSGTTTSGSTLNSAYKLVTGTTTQSYGTATMLGTSRDHCAAILILDVSSTDASASPGVVQPVLTIPASTISAGVTITLATVSPTLTIPAITPVLKAEVSTVSPTLTIPTPTSSADPSVTTTPVSPSLTIPAPTVAGAANVTTAVVSPTLTIPAPTITLAAQVATVSPTLTIPAPSVAGAANVTTAVVSPTLTVPTPSISTALFRYVNAVSANGRYLVDQIGDPILFHVDWAFSLMVDLTTTEMETYFANRESHGINACVVALVCGTTGGINADGRTYDGITPFTSSALALRSTYWARVDTMLSLAAAHGITIFGNPLNAQDWMDDAVTAGTTNLTTYGTTLATRYASTPNLVWILGIDYQPETWDHDPYFIALRDGLKTDADRLLTIQLNYEKSSGLNDSTWAADGVIDFSSAYSYWPSYDAVLDAYNTNPPGSRTAMPTWLSEANFETENNAPGGAATTDETMRRQFWWTMTSGGCGVAYGHGAIWDFDSGWDDTAVLDTTAVDQLDGAKQFLEDIPWYDLVPEQSNSLVTAGRGTYDDDVQEDVLANDYVTVAKTADGLYGVIYIPDWATTGTLTLNTAVMQGTVTVHRVDPTNFASTVDTAPFSSPGNNAAGDGDWVLLVQGTPATNVSVSVISPALSIPAPTIGAGAGVSPATVSPTLTIPAPTVAGGAVATPATVSPTLSIPAPSISAGVGLTLSTVSPILTVPAPSISAGVAITLTTVQPTLTVPAPSVSAGVGVTLSTVSPTLTVPAPAVTGAANVTTATVSPSLTVPAPVVAGAANVTTTTIQPALTIPTPLIATGGDAIVSVPLVSPVLSIPAPTVTTLVTLTLTTVSPTLSIPTPSVAGAANVTTTTVSPTLTIPAPAIHAGVTITVSLVSLVLTVPTPSIVTPVDVEPSQVQLPLTIPAPSISTGTDAVATLSTVQLALSLGTPTISAGTVLALARVLLVLTIPQPAIAAVSPVTFTQFHSLTRYAHPAMRTYIERG